MGNFGQTIKKFLGNKNTVTILAVLVGVVILWVFYNYRVNEAISTIRIPYAVKRIDSGKKIEMDNILYKDITSSTTKKSDIITDISKLNGKYICTGNSIPDNGFFYESQICDQNQISNSVYEGLGEGYTIYALAVDSRSTYANSIQPGDYIDLYLRAVDDNNLIVYGPLISSIEVRGVRDTNNRDVFWDSEAGAPATLLFAVPEEYSTLLNVSEKIRGYSIEILPVPRGASYTQNPGETSIASDELYSFIMSKAAQIGVN